MRRLLALAMAASVAMALGGCDEKATEPEPEEDCYSLCSVVNGRLECVVICS